MKAMRGVIMMLCVGVLGGCADTGGGYDSGYDSGYYVGHRDPWYHHGGYYYDDIYVPDYPDRDPGGLPDRPDARPVRPAHPIARPDRPTARPLPSIPTRARPMGYSSGGFSRGSFSRGGGRGR